jgi:hypothetical protein
MRYTRLWLGLGAVIVGSFAVLGYYGRELYRQAPPIPGRVVTTDGRVVYTGDDIKEGQNVWQSMGGQEVGTVWGHGAYVAPDWSADYLHREAAWILDRWAKDQGGTTYDEVGDEARAALKARLKGELRHNSYDPNSGDLTVSPRRGDGRRRRALRVAVRARPRVGRTARRLRHPGRLDQDPRASAPARRLLLLGLVGLLDGPEITGVASDREGPSRTSSTEQPDFELRISNLRSSPISAPR